VKCDFLVSKVLLSNGFNVLCRYATVWQEAKEAGLLVKFGGGFYCGKVGDIYVFNGRVGTIHHVSYFVVKTPFN
jgi:hypothetical protein